MAKVALGKGLRALISDESIEILHKRKHHGDGADRQYEYRDVQTGKVGSIGNIPISRITPNPFQPREEFHRAALEELKQSIIEKGVIQPITVRLQGEGFQLISGERRLRAATEAGFHDIPAYVIEVNSDREMLELALIENIQREKLNPIEIALGYHKLIEECDLTQEQISQRVGKDRSTVANFLRLLKLPDPIQASLRGGEISMGHARALINLEDHEAQLHIWQQAVNDQLSVRKVEELVGKYSKQAGDTKKKPADEVPKSIDAAQVEGQLRERLATKVKLQHTKKGNGEIVIEYYSIDDLERILELIGQSAG
ncbi:MAG: ParB/RepB/Spo0J family partition protein [Chlorobiales bacterium]|jgi:ParB family transcriptional regulator, chromosome partitioning protein|nr:ParB/RepB/Spo0J family partition protein [Chlorobiales bacterium]